MIRECDDRAETLTGIETGEFPSIVYTTPATIGLKPLQGLKHVFRKSRGDRWVMRHGCDDRAETLTGIETLRVSEIRSCTRGDDRAETLTGIETRSRDRSPPRSPSDDRAETLTGIETSNCPRSRRLSSATIGLKPLQGLKQCQFPSDWAGIRRRSG